MGGMNTLSTTSLGLVVLALCLPLGTLSAQSREFREAASNLAKAARAKDVGEFLDALETVVEEDDRRAAKLAVDQYAKLAKGLLSMDDAYDDFYELHRRAAQALKGLTSKSAMKELLKIRKSKRGDWHGRLLLLDAAAFHDGLDIQEACLVALADKEPQVIRRSLRYLRNTKKVSVVEDLVARYVELEEKYGKGKKRDPDWSRTLLSFQSTMTQILKVDLPSAIDWQNYVKVRKNRKDFFNPRRSQGRGKTALTLFGAAITGKNIVFILDVSGSMLSTDPGKTDPSKSGRRGKTVVGRDRPKGPPKPPEERRRISRAKKELARVVRALPADVRFNLIAYSSDVHPWEKKLVPSSSSNKKKATQFVEDLRAEGITVTDMALEEAFADLNIDTIYLVTDGAPTHIGQSGRGLPEDALEIISEIHERMEKLNFLRGVRIFTLGFRGAKEDFLQKLSKDHGGRYVAIE